MTEKAKRLTMSVPEAAEALGVARSTMYQIIHRADFPAFKLGNRTLISRSGLEEWVKAQGEHRMEVAQ